jgi:hypothetical protein
MAPKSPKDPDHATQMDPLWHRDAERWTPQQIGGYRTSSGGQRRLQSVTSEQRRPVPHLASTRLPARAALGARCPRSARCPDPVDDRDTHPARLSGWRAPTARPAAADAWAAGRKPRCAVRWLQRLRDRRAVEERWTARRVFRRLGRGLICGFVYARARESIRGHRAPLTTRNDGRGRAETVIPAPEKRKVGSSILPLTTI